MNALHRLLTGCVMVLTTVSLEACDMDKKFPDPNTEMVSKRQIPSHVAEFAMPTADYPALLGELDDLASKFQLKRYNAAPGLNELHGREVLFAAYEAIDLKGGRLGVLDVMDVSGPGKILVWIYDDHFPDPAARANFIAAVSVIVVRHGGKLGLYQAG